MADVISNLFIGVVSSLIVAFVLALIAMRAFHAQKNRELKQGYYVEYAKVATSKDYLYLRIIDAQNWSDCDNDVVRPAFDEYYSGVEKIRESLVLLRSRILLVASKSVMDAERAYYNSVDHMCYLCSCPDCEEWLYERINYIKTMRDNFGVLLESMRADLKLDCDGFTGYLNDLTNESKGG